jgi:hypothetical protein
MKRKEKKTWKAAFKLKKALRVIRNHLNKKADKKELEKACLVLVKAGFTNKFLEEL